MIQGVFPAAHIEGVAVGKEGLPSQLPDYVGHGFGVIRPQVGEITQLAEVDLDGHELVFKVDLVDAGGQDEPFQLLDPVFVRGDAEIGKIYLGRCHSDPSLT